MVPAFYYPSSYQEASKRFLNTAREIAQSHPDSQVFSLPIATKTSAEMAIHGFYHPAKTGTKNQLLIITSGIHGVEAFAGSAIQLQFMEDVLKTDSLMKTSVLILHGLNPFGFRFQRRVSESNVDLNRNFSSAKPETPSGYESLSTFLNPQGSVSAHWYNNAGLFLESLWLLVRYGKKALTQLIVGGQYQDSRGIYFGGSQQEENIEVIQTLFLKYGTPYRKILHIDLHTGYGQKGNLHFFSSQQAANQPGFKKLFSGFNIDLASDKDFYETSGSFDSFTIRTFSDKWVIPMTFEFGTMDSQTIIGGFLSLKNMIRENQGHHHGYVDAVSETQTKRDFLEMFNPSSPDWRRNVLSESQRVLSVLTTRFEASSTE